MELWGDRRLSLGMRRGGTGVDPTGGGPAGSGGGPAGLEIGIPVRSGPEMDFANGGGVLGGIGNGVEDRGADISVGNGAEMPIDRPEGARGPFRGPVSRTVSRTDDR